MAEYEWHDSNMCSTYDAICSICGSLIMGAHYWRPKQGKSCYYHEGTCITASRLGAKDIYGERAKLGVHVDGY